jgi:hypothetical protein
LSPRLLEHRACAAVRERGRRHAELRGDRLAESAGQIDDDAGFPFKWPPADYRVILERPLDDVAEDELPPLEDREELAFYASLFEAILAMPLQKVRMRSVRRTARRPSLPALDRKHPVAHWRATERALKGSR